MTEQVWGAEGGLVTKTANDLITCTIESEDFLEMSSAPLVNYVPFWRHDYRA